MTLRRYAPLAKSKGTVIPPALRIEVMERDGGCVGTWMPGDCGGTLELDHVRASHGMGMKSATTADNLVTLCGSHHRWKTAHGREARPKLLAYLERVTGWLHPTDPGYPFEEAMSPDDPQRRTL